MGLLKVLFLLSVVSGGGLNVVYFVCGVGNFVVNVYIDLVLVFNVDGIYIGCFFVIIVLFFDFEWVEVLKGFQGILYG